MFVIRWLLGRIILLVDFLTSPKKPKLTADQQTALDAKTGNLSLYQLTACPFCVKVRRAIKAGGLNIELRNIKEQANLNELVEQGGKRTVPCLRIENQDQSVTWLYESNDIINYLQKLQ